jgi:predicted nucleic acid-binding protein
VDFLLDTNILLRLAQPRHEMHTLARRALQALFRRKDSVFSVPQVLYEFWVVATRPKANNGLGLSPRKTTSRITKAASIFELVPDDERVYSEWLRLV